MGLDEAIDRYRLLLDQVNTTSDNGDPETSQEARSSALEKELREIVASIAGDPDSLLLKDGAELSSCKTFVFCWSLLLLFHCPRFVCTRNEHNMNANTPVILRSYASVHSVHESCNIWEAGRATSATPGIYNSTRIGNLGPFVGGAWGCSNPTHVLLEEAAKEFPGRKLASLISIGTGHPRTISLSKSTLTEVAMQIAKDCENVHERMLRFFANQKNVYHRLNVEQGLQMTDRDLLTDSAEVEAHTDAYLASAAVQLALPELAKLFAQAVGKVDPNLLRKSSSLSCDSTSPTHHSFRTAAFAQRQSFTHSTAPTITSLYWPEGYDRGHRSVFATQVACGTSPRTATICFVQSRRFRKDTNSA